ncbi:Na+/H+ antiporter NhaC [Marinigracilibium pacificum]|uniref:Na+/H+ antiporter NhaC n=1 Tax=Marinigracilibium pacificum TaxID=2729599 RepID=A0A848J271_9BACT|nr:Na+/H+ antiporter NhaC [Marinigracilibium pacificum]NMM48640.1 Na+/H+ antiporter NhaC [Marinigracilibium pacificum]
MTNTIKRPHFFLALIPVILLTTILFFNVRVFGDSSLDGANQIGLLFSAALAAIIALYLGVKWDAILDKTVQSISAAMGSILILLVIGSLAGTWMLSGVVPAMVYYGLDIMKPSYFLVASCIVSAIVSLATGSSWSTIATIGVALLGIGKTLGIDIGLTGGAIISGAYFGDKMSPLSDTTNLAPAMAGTDIITHIKYMAFTTVPSILITLVIFGIIGLNIEANGSMDEVVAVQDAIKAQFNINGWLFLVPVTVILLIIKKVEALPALLIGTLMGAIFALIFQNEQVFELGKSILTDLRGLDAAGVQALVSESSFAIYFSAIMKSMYGDVAITSANEKVSNLLSTGGMAGMLNTIWLILCAMIFGGMMEAGGLLKRIADEIIRLAKSTGSLIFSTAATCIFFNGTASDQYMAIVVPGRMFRKTFKDKDLKPEVLSRTLEDSGTVTSVLFPWNTCGATQAGVLGVATLIYAPYCFFNIISPIMTILFGVFNIKIRKYTPEEKSKLIKENTPEYAQENN